MGRSVGRSRLRRGKAKNNKKNKNLVKLNVKKTVPKKRKNVALRITNLNDFCLIKIFACLSIDDLVNIAKISSRFKSCSRSAFTQKFAKDVITVTNESTSAGQLPSVTLLTYFGNLIKKLQVKCNDGYHRFNNTLEKSILEHCKNSVTQIEFINLDKFAFIQIERPFKSVTKVLFIVCVVGKFIFELNKWFPNIKSLELIESKILSATDTECIERKFAKVEHLGIINPRCLDEDFSFEYEDPDSLILQPLFSNLNVKAAINLNPQLKSLKIKHNNNDLDHQNYSDDRGIKITPSLLSYINEKLPLLDKLDLFVTQTEEEPQRERRNVIFQNLKTMRFAFTEAVTLSHYDIATHQPAAITLIGDELSYACAGFLSKNKNWSKIVFNGKWESSESYKAVKSNIIQCPILKSVEMSINGLRGSEKDVLALLNECNLLKKLKIFFSTTTWSELKSEVNYNSGEKRSTELQLLYNLNILRDWGVSRVDTERGNIFNWMAELGGDLSDDDDDDEFNVQRFERNLLNKLESAGNYFFETYKTTFHAKRFLQSRCQSNYAKDGPFYCATYKKKDVV